LRNWKFACFRAADLAFLNVMPCEWHHREWWHLSFAGTGPSWHYDFPIQPR
jgi:hypothetical protein